MGKLGATILALLSGSVLTACLPNSVESRGLGRTCALDRDVLNMTVGDASVFAGKTESTPRGWIGLRVDAPVCITFTDPEGDTFGPREFDIFAIATPVDGRERPTIPLGSHVSVLAEPFASDERPRTTFIVLRVLQVLEQEILVEEEGQ